MTTSKKNILRQQQGKPRPPKRDRVQLANFEDKPETWRVRITREPDSKNKRKEEKIVLTENKSPTLIVTTFFELKKRSTTTVPPPQKQPQT